MIFLPKKIDHIIVPPIKCQGIKTKLVNFIASNIAWHGKGRWIEPFLGSGVVLFNIKPERALVSDTNKHIIKFYRDVQTGIINEFAVRDYLVYCGEQLLNRGKEFYYEIRNEFNESDGDSLKFIFLNRSGFNGIMRFNGNGKFNVPFNHKPDRYRRAYITKVRNQVAQIRLLLRNRDWEFRVVDWQETLAQSRHDDFVYLDPPYIGRHTDYYNGWNDIDATALADRAQSLPCGFALSMWKENEYRHNEHLEAFWQETVVREFSHFYHVGSTESLRHKMTEALAIKPGFVAQKMALAS